MKTKQEREAIAAELSRIESLNGGRLTADDVVAAAAEKNSILHALFEWDNRKAAAKFRLDQARSLIARVRVVVRNERTTISVVGYIRDPDAKDGEQGYVKTISLIGDHERSRRALDDEFARASSALRRAQELATAFGLEGEVAIVAESVDEVRATIKTTIHQRSTRSDSAVAA